MNTLLSGWLDIWLYVILAIGGFDLVMVVRHWRTWNWQRKLTALAVICLVLHVWEEWRIPGGHFYLYNYGSYNYPMSELTDMISNMTGIILGTIVMLWGGDAVSAFVVMFLAGLEVIVHCGILMARTQTLFAGTGIHCYYTPGMVTSLVGFLPITVGFIWTFIKKHPTKKDVLLGILFIFIIMQTNIILPEELLKNPDSPYAFTSRGYYEQFDVRFPNDPGV
jgi:hypothetical protein